MIIRLFFLLSGSFLFITQAHALETPPRPPVLSKYVEGVLAQVEGSLSSASGGGTSGASDTCNAAQSEAEEVAAVRDLLSEIEGGTTDAIQDFAHSPCFRNDAEALERYLSGLFRLALQNARSCNGGATAVYEAAIAKIAEHLLALRRAGLDPRVQSPVTGNGVSEIPNNASASDDDLLCPYNSAYATPTFTLLSPGLGCQVSQKTSSIPSFLQREIGITDRILRSGAGLARDLPFIPQKLTEIISKTALFIQGRGILRPVPLPFLPPTFSFVPTSLPAAGESGCKGFPSENGKIVSGNGVPLQNLYPVVLTRELSEVIAYLTERENVSWFDYLLALEPEITEEQGRESVFWDQNEQSTVQDLNRYHLGLESFSVLSIRDPQQRMERLANALHRKTLDFVRLAITLPGESASPNGPPLRSFARKYATFLSRMCVNKACGDILPRTFELSLRDECFSSFLMHRFFQSNPSASTLPACRALYVE